MGDTKIEWTDKTWNPIRGCSRVSAGCTRCYAERQAVRFAGESGLFQGFATRVNGYPVWTGKVELIESKLMEPLHWKKPKRIFVKSMSDLFHEALPVEDICRVFCVMDEAEQHDFQILTKRAWRLPVVLATIRDQVFRNHERWDGGRFTWPLPNVWLGVSVEDQKAADERIPLLLQTPAAVRFVSYEPALGPVDFRPWLQHEKYPDARPDMREEYAERWYLLHPKLDWIIVGGESGPGARSFDIAWPRSTIAQCKAAGVACFVKQLGAKPFDSSSGYSSWPNPDGAPWVLKDRKGGDISEWPEDLRVREFPR